MQLKITTHFILICWLAAVKGKALYSKGCFECEEEIWEEVPCEDIPYNSTTVSVTHYTTPIYKPTEASTKPSTTTTTTTKTTTSTTTSTTVATTSTTPFTTTSTTLRTTTKTPYRTTTTTYSPAVDPHKNCYCECKVDCKEFCRKIIFNSPEKQIVQVAKKSQPVKNGRFESTHFLQREFIPHSTHTGKVAEFVSKNKDDLVLDSEIHTGDRNKLLFPTIVEPIYHNMEKVKSKYSTSHPHYSSSVANAYDFAIPIENILSKSSKTLLDPVETVAISLNGKIENPSYLSYTADNNLSSALVKESQTFLDNDLNYNDSFDSLIKEFLSNKPLKETSAIQSNSKPFYSVAYKK